MPKAKQRRPSKPTRQKSKQFHSKKRGAKENDISEFRVQLDALGLKIIQVTADGNCFFRALADQLEGDEDEHEKYRSMVVKFIKNNREMFEPFVEDEVPFDEYCRSMGEDGMWAGHMELQAASLVTRINICIHLHKSPRWYIQNFDKQEVRMIHLSYHDGEHYNSVRSKADSCTGPARAFIIEGDADSSASPNQWREDPPRTQGECGTSGVQEESIERVKIGSGCQDIRRVEQVLRQVGGDVDAIVEVLVAEQGYSDHIVAEDEAKNSCDGNRDGTSEQLDSKAEDEAGKLDASGNDADSKRPDEKKVPRNKACPCGSKKKYKSCCGSVTGKSSARFPVNQTVDYGKTRKDRKQGRKGGSSSTSSGQSNGGPPDMGSLCI